jgi:hypothetical protein
MLNNLKIYYNNKIIIMSNIIQPVTGNIIKKAISFIRWFIPSGEKLQDIEVGLPTNYTADLQSIRVDTVEIDMNGNIIECWTDFDNDEFKTDNVFLMV